ncbi:MAG TPA: hypothetical protein VLB89_04020 [Gaiellaceae bacterium]|nr:hypothetical protein [Gaiellaceae bacterium]
MRACAVICFTSGYSTTSGRNANAGHDEAHLLVGVVPDAVGAVRAARKVDDLAFCELPLSLRRAQRGPAA